MSEVDDDRLLERARRGDGDAFSRLFGRYQRAVYRYAAYMCGPDAGDDIVQETFLVILRQTGRRDDLHGDVAAYIVGIARHLVLKRLSARQAMPLVDFDIVAPHEPATVEPATVLDDLTRAETIAGIRAAVRSLPPAYREVVVLCDLQEMDYAAAAGVLDCPIGTVRSRLHRARTLLSTKLAGVREAVHGTKD